MKSFIKNTILFSLPIIVIVVIFELLLRSVPNDYSFKKNFLDKNSDKIEVLYLGNSHVYFGINPIYSNKNSFNASHISQSLNCDKEILEKYDENWKNLKYIVIPIDYFSLYSTLEDSVEKWRIKNYNIYYNTYYSFILSNYFEILNGTINTNYLRLKDFYVYKKSLITSNKLGWGTIYSSTINPNLIESGLLASKRHIVEIRNIKNISRNIKNIQSIIEFSKNNNIKIIFITCPAHKTYTDNLEPNQLKSTIQTIEDIASKNSNCKYFNLLSNKSFTTKDFYDADHLNEIGAKKLTVKMDSIIKIF